MLQWRKQREAITRKRANLKNNVSDSDCSLQLDYMKLELVIAGQHTAVNNTFPGLVHTARHTMGSQ